MVVFELRVSLLGAEPAVWRRFRVPGDAHLPMVHLALQLVMGWSNSHMHEFVAADRKRYGVANGHDLPPGVLNEKKFCLSDLIAEPGDRCLYLYDFGDDWAHEVVLEAVKEVELQDEPMWCLGGEGACPPEDCGGIPGYLDLLEQLRDSDSVGHDEAVELYGEDFDPDAFDCSVFNESLKGRFSMIDEMMANEAMDEEMTLVTELQDFLESDAVPESAMSILGMDGFFAALAIHPVTVMPSTWLPVVWDMSGAGQQPEFTSKTQAEKGMGLMFSFMNSVSRQLTDASAEYEPLFDSMRIESDDDRMLAAMDWAVGFLLGTMIDEEVWTNTFSDAEGRELLAPFIVMSGYPDGTTAGSEEERAAIRVGLIDEMVDSVLDLQQFWEPMRRDYLAGKSKGRTVTAQPRVGRNDPCPCGSGKKFKQCCGK